MKKWIVVPALFLIFFFILPVLVFLIQGSDLKLLLESLQSYINDPYYQKIIGFTFFQAFLSTVASILIGLPGAYIMSHFKFKGKKILKALSMVPFVLPSILLVLGFTIFFGRNGFLNTVLQHLGFDEPVSFLYNFPAIIMAHSFYNFPLTMKLVGDRWESLEQNKINAAKTLGADRFRIFKTIVFPHIRPAIFSTAILTFMYCFMSFAIILVLGGGPQFTTIEVEMYIQVKKMLNYDAARSLAIIQSVIGISLLFLYNRFEGRFKNDKIGQLQQKSLSSIHGLGQLLIGMYAIILIILVAGPLLSIIFAGFLKRSGRTGAFSFSFDWYVQLFSPSKYGLTAGVTAITSSITIALISATVASFCGTIIGRVKGKIAKILQTVTLLPLAISSIIVSASYLFMYSKWNISFLILIAGHSLISIPLLTRSMRLGYNNLPTSIHQAALTLGSDHKRIIGTIDIPILLPTFVSSFAFAFALSLGDLNTSLMLAPQNLETIPLTMYRLISSHNFNFACALGTIMTIIAASAYIVFMKLGEIYARYIRRNILKP